eukprot:403347915
MQQFLNTSSFQQPNDITQNSTKQSQSQIFSQKDLKLNLSQFQDQILQEQDQFLKQRVQEIINQNNSILTQQNLNLQNANQVSQKSSIQPISGQSTQYKSKSSQKENIAQDQSKYTDISLNQSSIVKQLFKQIQNIQNQQHQQQLTNNAQISQQEVGGSNILLIKQLAEQQLKVSQQQVEQVASQYKTKNKLLKNKIVEQKQSLQDMQSDRVEIIKKNQQYIEQIQYLQEELVQIRHQLSSSHSQVEGNMNQRLQDMQLSNHCKYNSYRLNQFNESEQMKNQINQKLKAFEKDYIKIASHEDIVNEKLQQAGEHHKVKLQEIVEKTKIQVSKDFEREYSQRIRDYDIRIKESESIQEEQKQQAFEFKKLL